MNIYSSHFKELIRELRKYKRYYYDGILLAIQPLESFTEQSLNMIAAIEGNVLKLAGINKWYYVYDERPGLKISFPGINFYLPISVIEDVNNDKEIDKLKSLISKSEGKLRNESFINNAPASIIQIERNKLSSFMDQLNQL